MTAIDLGFGVGEAKPRVDDKIGAPAFFRIGRLARQ